MYSTESSYICTYEGILLELNCAKMKHTTIQSEGYISILAVIWSFSLSTRKYLSHCCLKGIHFISHSPKQCAKKFCITAHRSSPSGSQEAQSNLLYIHGYVHEAYEICSLVKVTDEVIIVYEAGSISGPFELRQPSQQLLISALESFLFLHFPLLLVMQFVQVLCGMGQDGHFWSLGRL